MPIVPEIQDRLLTAFPRSSNVSLFRAVQEGCFLASHLIEGESFLNNSLGRDLHGHIRRVGISYQIDLYCQRGDLPFVTTMARMPKGPLHWLEIKSTGARAHVCRVAEPRAFPDEAESRQDVRLTLQSDLLSWLDHGESGSLGRIIKVVPTLYAWLMFHALPSGQIDQLSWGSPAADIDDWIGYIDVLQEIGRSAGDAPPIPPTPTPRDIIRLRDHIAEQIEKNKKPDQEDK